VTPAVAVAGTHSGCGKTTIALGLMAALRQRGRTVQPFKVGPDFIDPGHHGRVCGRVGRNLDTWMLPADAVRRAFARGCAGADAAVIEGVMGLFDARSADDPRGGTADLARLLGLPVILVLDAAGLAASAAAVVRGFAEFDASVRVEGVIFNRVASPRHFALLEEAVRRHTRVRVLGWLPRRAEWAVPSRHLGLTTAAELADDGRWEALGRALAETVDVDAVLEVACLSPLTRLRGRGAGGEGALPPSPAFAGEGGKTTGRDGSPVVAVARDAAFCFYYPENLERLADAGGVIVPFSPLFDRELPPDTAVVYLGGGYPELHAERLAANAAMRDALRRFHAAGGTVYAECGGLMYSCRELVDVAGRRFPVLDLLPARAVMQDRRAALGYVEWRATADTPLGPAGTAVRGHEFHYSRLEPLGPPAWAAELRREGESPRPDGWRAGGLLAGYAHLHFDSCPGAAPGLLAAGKNFAADEHG
jgi:cobyrinic acid a,c-diamide synthase